MSKHRNNLERLLKKMETRYGPDDEIVIHLQQALMSLERRRDDDAVNLNRGIATAETPWLRAMRGGEQRLS